MFEPSETLYENIDTEVEHWDDLDVKVQADLIAWLNVRRPDDADTARLLALYVSRGFEAWDCPLCSDHPRVYRGNPENWDHFQSVLNQDFSFFGDRDKYTEEYIAAMCDSCRCHG